MEYTPSLHEVHRLIEHYAEDFGVTLPYEDAERILKEVKGRDIQGQIAQERSDRDGR